MSGLLVIPFLPGPLVQVGDRGMKGGGLGSFVRGSIGGARAVFAEVVRPVAGVGWLVAWGHRWWIRLGQRWLLWVWLRGPWLVLLAGRSVTLGCRVSRRWSWPGCFGLEGGTGMRSRLESGWLLGRQGRWAGRGLEGGAGSRCLGLGLLLGWSELCAGLGLGGGVGFLRLGWGCLRGRLKLGAVGGLGRCAGFRPRGLG